MRAYQKCTQEGLAGAVVIEKQQGCMLDIRTDYNGLGKIQYLVAQRKIPVLDTAYTDKVVMHVMVPIELKEEFTKAVTEGTSGAAKLDWGEQTEFAVIADEVRIFA